MLAVAERLSEFSSCHSGPITKKKILHPTITMKKLVLLLSLTTTMVVTSLQAQTAIAEWNFSDFGASVTNTSFGPVAATAGVNTNGAVLNGVHSNALSVWSHPVGNGNADSLSANHWTAGDYFQFQFSTLTFSNIGMAWSQARSSTGPTNFSLRYSTDGSSFTTFTNYIVQISTGSNAWTSASNNPIFDFNYYLSSITALDNQADVYFRLVSEQTGATTGTGRIDNIAITGVPEPSTYAMLALAGAGFAGYVIRRRRR